MMPNPFQRFSQFYKSEATEQKPHEVVDASGWLVGEIVYKEGAREKRQLISSVKPEHDFLQPNHDYMLKRAYQEQSGTILYEQFWNEIVAYKLGRAMKIPVPPAFVAYYAQEGREPYYGSLIEWFYGYGNQSDVALRGDEVVMRYDRQYDTRKGERHNFQLVAHIFEDQKVENWLQEWMGILLFDAIIANTDRHQDNWQIVKFAGDLRNFVSPAFDNGTSLGYNFRNGHLAKKLKELDSYAKKGTHHMRWHVDDSRKAGHFELLQKLIAEYPETKCMMQKYLAHDISSAFEAVFNLTKFQINDERYKLKPERADFMIRLVQHRHNLAQMICA